MVKRDSSWKLLAEFAFLVALQLKTKSFFNESLWEFRKVAPDDVRIIEALFKFITNSLKICFCLYDKLKKYIFPFLPYHVSTHLKMWDFPERLWKFSPGETNEPWPFPNQRAKHLHSLTTTTGDVMAARCLDSMTFLLILLCHIRTSWGV